MKAWMPLLCVVFLSACAGSGSLPTASAVPSEQPTATRTPGQTPSASPTPELRYEEIQGLRVPMNVYLDDEQCIAMELQGEEKCVNMFVAGKSDAEDQFGFVPGDFPAHVVWKGIVYVVGDVRVGSLDGSSEGEVCMDNASLTVEPGTEVYVAANKDIEDLYAHFGEAHARSGINTEFDNLDGFIGVSRFMMNPIIFLLLFMAN